MRVLTVVNTWNQNLYYFILIMRCRLVAIKEAVLFFPLLPVSRSCSSSRAYQYCRALGAGV